MPYKDKEKQREYDKERMRKARQGRTERVEQSGVEQFEGKPRYLKLSDGQALDRANQPNPNKHLPAMIACNRDYRCKMGRSEGLGRLLVSLNKEITGLDGKRVSLLGMVRYGIGGMTFAEIKDAIK